MTRNLKATIAAIAIAVSAATAANATTETFDTSSLTDQWEIDTLGYFHTLLMNEIWSIENSATFEEIEQVFVELNSSADTDQAYDPFGEGYDDGC